MGDTSATYADGQPPRAWQPPKPGTLPGVVGNALYYGDNLDVLRRHIKAESVDLVYLDPPFNSNANYNVLFAEQGAKSAAQINAFGDTWQWDEVAAYDFQQTVEQGGPMADALRALRTLLGASDMLAYLSMMAPRLVELRRSMKPTASIYLHCDPTAGHYLKLLMDATFDARNFKAEIVWKRSSAHSDTRQGRKQPGHIHDVLLFYTKGPEWTWNPLYTPYDETYIATFYNHVEAATGRRFQLDNLTAAKPGGDTSYEWRGAKPYVGRYWAYSKDNMEEFENQGRLVYGKSGIPRYKRFLDEMPGVALQDVWTDIPPISAKARERLGFPTQKPAALLARIIEASSSVGDVVLDPFCGCGTTIAAAQSLDRRWIGIDITHLAVGLIKHRLIDTYGPTITSKYKVVGEPTDVDGARQLAASDPFQFQAWALGLVGARVASSAKKGGDQGIDGRLYFHDGGAAASTKQIVFSVKAGHLVPTFLRDLRGVIGREQAQIGVLLSFETPTAGMRAEAASAGFYASPWGSQHPRLQLLTVAQLLDGKEIDYPHLTGGNVTHRRAPRQQKVADQGEIAYDVPPEQIA